MPSIVILLEKERLGFVHNELLARVLALADILEAEYSAHMFWYC